MLARILYHQDSGHLNLNKPYEDCTKYIESEQVPHAIQPRRVALHLVAGIKVTYKFRSQRGGIHIAPTYGPNQMDAKFIIEVVRWLMNETLRIYWVGDREKVAKAIREILQFDVPCVGKFDQVILVQRTDLSPDEEVLVLLHFAGEVGFSRTQLGKYVQAAPPRVTEALRRLTSPQSRHVVQLSSGSRQGKLDGGNLYGRMTLSDLSDAELASLTKYPMLIDQPFGTYDPKDPIYVKLARRVIAVLQPKLARLIATLRNQYGQYWLQEPRSWDSRQMTLGTYCSSVLGLLWWYEESQAWCRFLPTPSGSTITPARLPGRGYEEFLTEADWRRLQATRCLSDVSTEVQLLGQVTRSLEYREYAQAFVETISALELAMSNCLKAGNVSASIRSAIQRFENSGSLSSQAAVMLLLLDRTRRNRGCTIGH